MKKQKQQIEGNISLKINNEKREVSFIHLGSVLEGYGQKKESKKNSKKKFSNHLLNSDLVNDKLFFINLMNEEKIKLTHTFHYRNQQEKINHTQEYIQNTTEAIHRYISKHYPNVSNVEYHLQAHVIYDVDYLSLPINEIQKDLTQEEFQEVMKEMEHYVPTSILKKPKTYGSQVFFEE